MFHEPEIMPNDRGTVIKFKDLHIQLDVQNATYANEYVLQEWYMLPTPFENNNYAVLVTKQPCGNNIDSLDSVPIGEPRDDSLFSGGYQRRAGGFTPSTVYPFNYIAIWVRTSL